MARLGVDVTAGRKFRVRDLWNHTDLQPVVAPFDVTSPSLGTEEIYNLRFYPS